MPDPDNETDNETDPALDVSSDRWHWTSDAAHYNPDNIPDS